MRTDTEHADHLRTTPTGFVYIIGANDGPVKIGYGKDAHKRLVKLQTGNPQRLKILWVMPGALPDERAMHRLFAEHRIHLEWFHRCPQIEAMIAAHAAAATAPDGRHKEPDQEIDFADALWAANREGWRTTRTGKRILHGRAEMPSKRPISAPAAASPQPAPPNDA